MTVDVIEYRKETTQYVSEASLITTKHSSFVERERPIKLYRYGELSDLINKLKHRYSHRLLTYIYDTIAENSDTIKLDRELIYQVVGLGRSTYYKAIDELLALQLIAKKSQNVYYINPNFLFKGDRIKFVAKRLGDLGVNVVQVIPVVAGSEKIIPEVDATVVMSNRVVDSVSE